jgi:branched-subunit amino acid aminotransferase/4-amino-4-deoxychorismate lyase
MISSIININGQLLPEEKTGLSIQNRAFKFGDSVFESIRISKGRALFLEDHFSRITKGMKELKIIPSFQWDLSGFRKEILRTVESNKIERGGRIRYTAFRKGEGLYVPKSREMAFTVEAYSGESDQFELNTTGQKIGFYKEFPLQYNRLSQFKTNNCLPYIMAGMFAQQEGFDEVIMLNDSGNICEATSSNVFLFINGILYTPALTEGCTAGVMRKKIIQLAKKMNIALLESSLSPNLLEDAEEVFFTNAINGLKWAAAWEKKRYFHKMSARFTSALNEIA